MRDYKERFLEKLFVLTFENDGITSEYLELVHLGLSHLNDRVVILFRILDLELMWRLFAIHDRSRKVFFSSIGPKVSE